MSKKKDKCCKKYKDGKAYKSRQRVKSCTPANA